MNKNKRIIAFIGFGKAGKDMASEYIINNSTENGEYKRVAFADKLKDVFCEENNITREYLELNKPSYREKLISMGEGKREDDPDYWINLVREDIISSDKNVIITDLRRVREVEFLLNLKQEGYNVQIIHVLRPLSNKGIFEFDKDTCLTVLYLKFYELLDYEIVNDSTLIEYYKKLKWILL